MHGGKADREAVMQETELNLSDFALFLSVMKNKEAHESTLSIIMDDPNLKLEEVHVEEVILNKSGKRAIRLDAWAKDMNRVQYNMEMQNDAENDDVRKRSRYYQGMMDTPILKSGKTTKYRELPSTVIIFITQEDIFGKDRAKYTFTEQCEEISGLHLGDGTTKIFLNMTSKNGAPELVSLLQYMKNTRLDNPEILVKDRRIQKLDEVVTEVKESEEWEAARMSIYSVGLDAGERIGKEIGKKIGKEILRVETVCKKLRKGKNTELIADEMEDDIQEISQICEIANAFAPKYASDDVAEIWLKRKES